MNKSKQKVKRKLPEWMGSVYNDKADDDQSKICSKVTSSTISHTQIKPRVNEETLAKTTQDKNSSDTQKSVSFDELVINSLPYLEYTGSIIYSYNINDCCLLCDDILETLGPGEEMFVGFDIEWPVTFQKGNSGKVSLIQICVTEQKCFLFHVAAMPKFPQILRDLIEDERIKKIGLNVENDFWKLDQDCNVKAMSIIPKSMIELKTLANAKLKSNEHWSLNGLVQNVLHKKLNKDAGVRCGDWANFPLTDEQQKYAAIDAYASLKLYNILIKK